MASVSSVWPLPCTPATQSTSPARMVKRDAVEVDVAERVAHPEVLHDQRVVAQLGLVLVDDQLDRAADHERGELGVGGGGLGLADDLAEADHGDLVGDLADLAELVGDEDDRLAGLLELAHDLHQLVGLLGRQDRGRLVEDQHLGVAREGLDDLDPLLDADGELLHQGVGVDVEAEPLGDLADALAGGVERRGSRRSRWTRCRA